VVRTLLHLEATDISAEPCTTQHHIAKAMPHWEGAAGMKMSVRVEKVAKDNIEG